jgi:hypothetical protein
MNTKSNLPTNLTPEEYRQLIAKSANRVFPAGLIKALTDRVTQRLSALSYAKVYTLREICGKDFWKALTGKYPPKDAGQCMAFLVETKRVPCVFVGKNGSNSLCYRRT